jgi:hypothetical protein
MKHWRAISLVLASILLLMGCSEGMDWERISRQDIPSPDGRHIATVFVMCCHCTTGDFPQLSVRDPGVGLEDHGNAFRGDAGEAITARWTSPTNLVVCFYSSDGPPLTLPQSTNFNGVRVDFEKP